MPIEIIHEVTKIIEIVEAGPRGATGETGAQGAQGETGAQGEPGETGEKGDQGDPGVVQTVTGLNTDNADPANPVIHISVDGDTITGAGTPSSPLVASGGGGEAPAGRIITAAGAVNMVGTDQVVEIAKTVPQATVVNLPADPVDFKIYTVKDGANNCFTYPITLTPPSGDIDADSTFVMETNGESESFYFNGTDWRLV